MPRRLRNSRERGGGVKWPALGGGPFLTEPVDSEVSAQAAGDVKCLARDVGRVVRSEEGHCGSDLLNLADAAKRGGGFDPVAHIALIRPADTTPSVAIMPGLTALTRILRGASSFDSTAEIAS